jgi:hypothetical protein
MLRPLTSKQMPQLHAISSYYGYIIFVDLPITVGAVNGLIFLIDQNAKGWRSTGLVETNGD